MNLLKNFKISTKLLILSVTTFVISGVVSIVGLMNVNAIFTEAQKIYAYNVVPMGFVSDMRGSFHATRANLFDFILAENQSDRQKYLDGTGSLNDSLLTFTNSVKSYKTHLDTNASHLEGEAEAVLNLYDNLDITISIIDKIKAEIDQGNNVAALSLVQTDFRDVAYSIILPNVQKLNSMHLTDVQNEILYAKSIRTVGVSRMLGILIFNAIMLFIVSFAIIKSLARPLGEIVSVTELLAVGDLNLNIGYISKDEMGILADKFRIMVNNLKRLADDIEEANKAYEAGDIDFRIDETPHGGVYKEMAHGINNIADGNISMIQNLIENLNDLSNGNFNTVVRDYHGKKQILSIEITNLKNMLQSISREIVVLSQSGTSGKLAQRADATQFKGDWNYIMNLLNNLLDAVVLPIHEFSDVLIEISKGNLSTQVIGDYQGDFALIKSVLNNTINNLASYISDISETVSQIAHNNLDVTVSGEYLGDFHAIKDSLNLITESLNSVFSEISNATNFVYVSAKQISESSTMLAQAAIEQSEVVQNLAADVDICAKQTLQDGENAEIVGQVSDQSKSDISVSTQEMDEMLSAINGIKESSDNISKIIKVIDDIAFQTNLLALNAAVEAARAGQHGKGFAVVAEEVRNLAARSQHAAKETTTLIEDSINRVSIGTKIASETAGSLGIIVEGINKISDLMKEIDASTDVQAQAFSRVTTGLVKMSGIVQSNSSVSRENVSSSQEIASQSEVLKNMLGAIKLKRM